MQWDSTFTKRVGIMCPNQVNVTILVYNMLVKSKHLDIQNDCHNACVSKVTAQTSGKMGATACEDGLGGGSKIRNIHTNPILPSADETIE